jgi:hypothetical protein
MTTAGPSPSRVGGSLSWRRRCVEGRQFGGEVLQDPGKRARLVDDGGAHVAAARALGSLLAQMSQSGHAVLGLVAAGWCSGA